MFYMIGILAFIVFMFFTLVFYKYLFRVCEKLKIKINKNILCIIAIVLFYGSLILGMMNKYVSVLLVFILYLILIYLFIMIFYKLLKKYKWFMKIYLILPVFLSLLSIIYGVYNIYDVRTTSYEIN